MQNRFELPMMLCQLIKTLFVFYPDLQDMGFKRSMAYRLLQGDLLPVVIIGKRRFIRHTTLIEWLAAQEHITDGNVCEKSAESIDETEGS